MNSGPWLPGHAIHARKRDWGRSCHSLRWKMKMRYDPVVLDVVLDVSIGLGDPTTNCMSRCRFVVHAQDGPILSPHAAHHAEQQAFPYWLSTHALARRALLDSCIDGQSRAACCDLKLEQFAFRMVRCCCTYWCMLCGFKSAWRVEGTAPHFALWPVGHC
jgi:hypothetical protein